MPEMILVKSVEVQICDTDRLRLVIPPDIPVWAADSAPLNRVTFETETVIGQTFTTCGKRVCLGMAKEVRDVLGLPLKCFENQRREIDSLRGRLSDFQGRLNGCSRKCGLLTLWQRIKILFGANPLNV